MKPKVLIITSSYPKHKGDINGNFVYELSKRLTNEFDVFVLAPLFKNGNRKEIIDNITIYRHKQFFLDNIELAYGSDILAKIKVNKLYYFVIPFYFLYQFIAIIRIVKSRKIDIIHAHWLLPNGLLSVVYKKILNKNIKILVTIHGADIWSLNNLFFKFLKKFTLKNINNLTVVSNAIKNEVQKYNYQKEIYVYPMGVDTNLFNPENKNPEIKTKYNIKGPFIIFVGGIIERKGIRYLISAMPEVVKYYPDTTLLIIGDGNLKEEMVNLCITLNISNNIIFTGTLANNDLPPFYATANIFILPSLSEGWPVVVMEALSSGCKSIVTNISVFKDIKGKYPFLSVINTKDSHQISDTIIKFLKMEDYTKLSNDARRFIIENFDWEIVRKNYLKLLNE